MLFVCLHTGILADFRIFLHLRRISSQTGTYKQNLVQKLSQWLILSELNTKSWMYCSNSLVICVFRKECVGQNQQTDRGVLSTLFSKGWQVGEGACFPKCFPSFNEKKNAFYHKHRLLFWGVCCKTLTTIWEIICVKKSEITATSQKPNSVA